MPLPGTVRIHTSVLQGHKATQYNDHVPGKADLKYEINFTLSRSPCRRLWNIQLTFIDNSSLYQTFIKLYLHYGGLVHSLRYIHINDILSDTALGYRLESQRMLGIFLFTTVSRPALGPTRPPIQGVPGTLSLGVDRPGSETEHSPPSNSEVKNAWSYTSIPSIRFHGVVLS